MDCNVIWNIDGEIKFVMDLLIIFFEFDSFFFGLNL